MALAGADGKERRLQAKLDTVWRLWAQGDQLPGPR